MYYLIEALLALCAILGALWLRKKKQTLNTAEAATPTQPPTPDEAAKAFKNLKVCAAIFGVTLIFDLAMIFIMRVNVSIAIIGVILLKTALFWYGWNAEKGETYRKAAISSGRLSLIMFVLLGLVQGLFVILFLRQMGSGAAGGVVEMLLYALLAWYYYKNAKRCSCSDI